MDLTNDEILKMIGELYVQVWSATKKLIEHQKKIAILEQQLKNVMVGENESSRA